jgi:hypothetical protein
MTRLAIHYFSLFGIFGSGFLVGLTIREQTILYFVAVALTLVAFTVALFTGPRHPA